MLSPGRWSLSFISFHLSLLILSGIPSSANALSEPSSSTRDLGVDSHSPVLRKDGIDLSTLKGTEKEKASSSSHSSASLQDEYLIPQGMMDTDSLGEKRRKRMPSPRMTQEKEEDDVFRNCWSCNWKNNKEDEEGEKKGEDTLRLPSVIHADDERERTKRSPDGLHVISSYATSDEYTRSSSSVSSSSSSLPSFPSCGSLSSSSESATRTRTPGAHGPTFLDHFSEEVIETGESVSLRCIASGHPLPQVTWLLDGMPVPDNSRFRTGDYVTRESVVVSYVNITSVVSQDGGLYECTACNEVSFIKHAARLKIPGPPFVRSMDNMTAVAGETFSVTCPVSGHPIESIFWEKDNQKLPFNHRQNVFPQNGTFILSDVDKNIDQGSYKCTAIGKDNKSSSSNTIHISVRVRPEIEPFTFPKSLHEGKRFQVLCSVTKGDAPISIKWYKGSRLLGVPPGPFVTGSPVDSSPTELVGISTVTISQYSSALMFESIRPEHRGNYTCEASNAAGIARHQETMVIHVPPKWIIEPRDTPVLKGKTALLDCQADGFPPPSVRWSKADPGMEGHTPISGYKPIISNQRIRVFQNGSLVINNVHTSDGSSYMCQVSNGVGSGLSKVFKLIVHVAAHFKTKFRAETVRKGHEARMKCEAEGEKPMTLSWTKDKVDFRVTDDPRYDIIEMATKDGVNSEIVIKNADRRDSALFTCFASNSFGGDNTNIQLIMQEPPDPPQEVKLISADGRTAQIAWSPSYAGNSPILNYIVQYKLSSDKWTDRGVINMTVIGAENYSKMINLKPVHEYSVRVFATNSLGRSEPSDPLVFKTDEEAPGGPPFNIKAIALSSKSLRISWKPPREDLQFGFIKGYYVGYKVFGADAESFVYKTLEVGSSEFQEGCVLDGLKKFTKYAVTVQAFNSKGTGPASEIIEVQTLQNDPPNPPQIKISSTSATNIHLTWNVRGQDHESPQVNGFVLHQRKVTSQQGDPTGDWEELKLPGDRLSHSFERLACGTRYQYYIIAFNAVGKSDPSEIISTKTEGRPPIAAEKNSFIHSNTSAATIFLDAWHDGNCPISSFEVHYRPKKSKSGKWESFRVFPAEHKQPVLKDLLPSTPYDLKVMATNEAGSTESQYSFTTSSLIRAPVLSGNEAISFNSSLPIDISLILPTTISVVMVVLLFFVVRIWLLKKRNVANNNFYGAVYGSQSPYDSAKSQAGGSESVCLNEMGTNCGVKKIINGSEMNGGCRDSGCYPSPYDMTKLNGNDCNGQMMDGSRSHTTPLKPNGQMMDCGQGEPMYATVKRTPRAPRTDNHVYQYPLTLQGAFITSGQESCFDTESCVSGPTSTAYIRIQDADDMDKAMSGVPLLISEDGRQISVGTLRRPLGHQPNFQR